MNTATTLTAGRILLTLACFPLALSGMREAFLVVLVLAMLTDVLDGYIARTYKQVTEYGAKLDSIADMFLVLSSVYWVYLFEPLMAENLTTPLILIAIIALLQSFCYYKHGRLATFHLYSAKIAATFVQLVILWTIAFGWNPPLYWASQLLIFLAEIEYLLVILFVKKPKTNMKSYFNMVE